MASNTAIVAARRLHVEKLVIRGLSQREILKALTLQRVVNPKTGKPWSLGTVNNDIQALEQEWNSLALMARSERKAKVTAELQELKRQAWATRDFRLVADLLKQERDLYNLDEPVDPLHVHHHVTGEVNHQHTATQQQAAIAAMSEAELELYIENMMIAAMMPDESNVIEGDFEHIDNEVQDDS